MWTVRLVVLSVCCLFSPSPIYTVALNHQAFPVSIIYQSAPCVFSSSITSSPSPVLPDPSLYCTPSPRRISLPGNLEPWIKPFFPSFSPGCLDPTAPADVLLSWREYFITKIKYVMLSASDVPYSYLWINVLQFGFSREPPKCCFWGSRVSIHCMKGLYFLYENSTNHTI